MTPTRKRRLVAIATMLLGVGAATALVLTVLGNNLNAFRPPAEVAAGLVAEGQRFRLGGMVVDGSVQRDSQSLKVSFALADLEATVPVQYDGILPDLFREGQGIVADGVLEGGVFVADTVLAKHDETYMPPELADALKAQGYDHSAAAANPQTEGEG